MIDIKVSIFKELSYLALFSDTDDLSLIDLKYTLELLLDNKSSDLIFFTTYRPKYFDL